MWGQVVEVEDLTSNHAQTHIGRVNVLIRERSFVNDSVMLQHEKTEFHVDELEDGIKIIGFGPRHDHSRLNSANSIVPDDERLVVDFD